MCVQVSGVLFSTECIMCLMRIVACGLSALIGVAISNYSTVWVVSVLCKLCFKLTVLWIMFGWNW